ncbi:ATP-binding cassette domain-containing protein [uncultured Cohaesibacter sp.]|uniref:ATP-binding cassette domain-containing protein n=1 Tax=uncultured Cohaesibacter sp. TaxID=1002546 RepID=UPI0029C73D76|nr:ATP-binding cassette domain-containing protein [uncultured Cohaesibacter sp.]
MDRTTTRQPHSKPETATRVAPFASSRLLAPLASLTGKVQRLGMSILGTLLLLAIFAPLLSPYAPDANVCAPFAAPNADHWLGCNDFGQDLFAQLIHGARISLLVGILVATFATAIATFLALLSGLHANGDNNAGSSMTSVWIDRIIMRLVDVTLALPFLPLVIVLGVYFGASVTTQILVITLVMWAQPLRELRSQILAIRTASYVEASRAMGASGWFVSLRHILPDLAPLITPQFVRIAHNAILVEAALSFLGLGDPLQNSWGSILFHANARSAFLTGTWVWWILPPGFAIALTVVSFAFIGYGFDASIGTRRSHKSKLLPRKPPREGSPAPETCLEVRNLVVSFPDRGASLRAVDNVSFGIRKGELLGLVGESGSGKTTIALTILRLLRPPVNIPSGEIWLEGEDLLQKPEVAMRTARTHDIAFIPQNAMNALNPVMTIRTQLAERLRASQLLSPDQIAQTSEDWMQKVGLAPAHLDAYPHELSGGMRQRAVIAIALANNPSLLIADEPTSGLDGLVESSIMELLLGFRKEMSLTILLVSHNLRLVARHCDRLAVLHDGRIVETGTPKTLMTHPANPHTRALFDSVIALSDQPRWASKGTSRKEAAPPILGLTHVSKHFAMARTHWPRSAAGKDCTIAVRDISFSLSAGESLGVVGQSGAGKSTLARLIMGAITPDHGTITLMGKSWQTTSRKEQTRLRQQIHHVYQDPYQSLNNRLTIADLVAEPLLIQSGGTWRDHKDHVLKALEEVRLPSDEAFLARSPISLSGGQRQRVAFARAIITNPALIIADEPTSMLDQSIRMEVMDVMAGLRDELGTAFVLITHDIALARHFCDRLAVMKDGEIIELAPTEELIDAPRDPHTRALIAAARQ